MKHSYTAGLKIHGSHANRVFLQVAPKEAPEEARKEDDYACDAYADASYVYYLKASPLPPAPKVAWLGFSGDTGPNKE